MHGAKVKKVKINSKQFAVRGLK